MFPSTQLVPGSRRRTKTGGSTGRFFSIWTARRDAKRPPDFGELSRAASVVDRAAVLVIAELGRSRSQIR